ncbi:hypothetical protein [Mycolicibacterium sp. P1-5]|uniref:hypothetical protein n=1 Tax=Mycolicibacterium sp. P1-5 TaxID=2024617 RepID=UPI0011EC07D9|nr:hypothetical protein [Mycolicibacterium sp. P1-5]KAA0105156.1 hypothetical protein CIW47_20440 [Mycolicibacterium sp. P1-5]
MASAESRRTDSVRDIFELFGAINRAVHEAKDPKLSATADSLIPGLMANPNWYDEIEGRYFPDDRRTEPNATRALSGIAAYDAAEDTGRLTRSQKARLLYGISVLGRLKSEVPNSLPDFDESKEDCGAALDGSLAAIAPTSVEALSQRQESAKNERSDFLALVSSEFNHPKDFAKVLQAEPVLAIRDNQELHAPLCQTAVVPVDGYQSVIVDTKFTSEKISLEQLKSIVNPFNWDEDYAELFVAMQAQTPELLPDGWRRVLETVRLIGDKTLRTPLKFFPSMTGELEAQMNYDLDMTNFDAGDKQVRVDRGFINMKVRNETNDPAQGGVRVVTRKVVHIAGISAFAQARLVCIGGYGTASADFLLGSAGKNAAKQLENPKPFDFPANEKQAGADAAQSPATPQATVPVPAATAITHFVPAAVDAWTECAQELTNGYFDVAQKWVSGSLSLTDLADYTTRLSGELASSPFKYLQAMTTPRSPGQPGRTK